jgi:hypothetical protein
MKPIFETFTNSAGQFAVARGRNTEGEYVVTLYAMPSVTRFRAFRRPRAISTYFTDDHADACGTAIAMTFPPAPKGWAVAETANEESAQ